jgi:hypothetical protein
MIIAASNEALRSSHINVKTSQIFALDQSRAGIWRVKRAAAGEPERVGNHLIGITRAEIKLKLAMQA